MKERHHLTPKNIIDFNLLFTRHLTVYDDNTCEYHEGYSDQKLRDTYGDPLVTDKQVVYLRERLYGTLRSAKKQKPNNFNRRLEILERKVAELERLQHTSSPQLDASRREKVEESFRGERDALDELLAPIPTSPDSIHSRPSNRKDNP